MRREPDPTDELKRLDLALEELRHATFGLFGPALRARFHAQLGWEWSAVHYRLLRVIEATDPLRPTIGELGAAALIDKARASRLVSQLQTGGLVRRRMGRLDHRRREIELTEEGRAVLAEARAVRLAYLRRVLAGWEESGAGELAVLLERFNSAIRDVPPM
ncbi:hypothetical protein GCM10023194_31220 [Planotetraspora phitsanulokensis]|uniref:HTH marR-type domain-containing protein n=1 Tax=Planotetraspora phitsanulokensis TaxID=575192 RepID=A0A8J3TZT9_9ACTN|nr:MarR family transcriptional regulator [Planotetraspora phitsanulokensis]GII35740.1 hypothetical protein Pph01_07430 [Planotetraspora phitsanulokensis]